MDDLKQQTLNSVREFQTLLLMACLERLGGEVAFTTEDIGKAVGGYRLVLDVRPEESRCVVKLVSLERFDEMRVKPGAVVL